MCGLRCDIEEGWENPSVKWSLLVPWSKIKVVWLQMESIIGHVAWSNIPMGVHWALMNLHICGHVYIWMCIHLETQSLQLMSSPITLTFTYWGRVSHCTQSSWILDTFISQFSLGDIFPISSSQYDNTGDTYDAWISTWVLRSELSSFKLESTGFIHWPMALVS